MTSILDVKNVSKSYGGVAANTDISLSVKKGAITGLIGPNGSGKTTMFKILSTLMSPSNGNVSIFGFDTVENYIGWICITCVQDSQVRLNEQYQIILDDVEAHPEVYGTDAYRNRRADDSSSDDSDKILKSVEGNQIGAFGAQVM